MMSESLWWGFMGGLIACCAWELVTALLKPNSLHLRYGHDKPPPTTEPPSPLAFAAKRLEYDSLKARIGKAQEQLILINSEIGRKSEQVLSTKVADLAVALWLAEDAQLRRKIERQLWAACARYNPVNAEGGRKT